MSELEISWGHDAESNLLLKEQKDFRLMLDLFKWKSWKKVEAQLTEE